MTVNDTSTPQDDNQVPRRDFLEIGWRVLGGVALLGAGYVGLRFVGSSVEDSPFGGVINAGALSDIAPGTVTAFPQGQFFLVRNQTGGLLALYRKCTHLDCVVRWNPSQERFNCPCHGSQFTPDGDVLNPPAPRPLVHFPISIREDGVVSVDTGELIERTAVQDDDWTYPPDAP